MQERTGRRSLESRVDGPLLRKRLAETTSPRALGRQPPLPTDLRRLGGATSGGHEPRIRAVDQLPDVTAASAILDRIFHHCEVVVLNGDSYRLPPGQWSGSARDLSRVPRDSGLPLKPYCAHPGCPVLLSRLRSSSSSLPPPGHGCNLPGGSSTVYLQSGLIATS
jgi:hypothetical protein